MHLCRGPILLPLVVPFALSLFAQAADLPSTSVSTPARVVTPPGADESLAADQLVLRDHLTTLANPFFEGRYPGSRGGKLAADYIQWQFEHLGLKPAFTDAADSSKPSFRQPFPGPSHNEIAKQDFSFTSNGKASTLTPGKDFNVLGFSGNGTVTAPLVFAGYGITMGEDGYSSFPDSGPDVEGKIAIILRFEPMTDEGTSKWSKEGWSFSAGLEPKIGAAIRRGAKAVILVNPPGAKDDRVDKLEDVNSLTAREPYEAPVIMATIDTVDALVRTADPQGRSLLDLRKLADEKGVIVELPNASVTIDAAVNKVRPMTDNVGAILPGVGDLADRFIVVGGHYDHLGHGQVGVRFPSDRGQIHPGADDNASGTSGMLLIAKRISEAAAAMPAGTPRRSILFLGFSAEESGLNGSRFYTQHPIVPIENHDFMLNLDMIGRLGEKPLEAGGVGTAEGFADWLAPYFESSGLKIAGKQSGMGPSDHASFYAVKVPVLFLFSGMHPQYHRPTDVAALINWEGAAKIADMGYRIALDASLRPEPFKFTSPANIVTTQGDEPAPPPTRGRIRFGISPGDYSGEDKGVLVGEVLPETPASKAGIKANDLIIKWNDNRIAGVEEWMPYFNAAKPGDVVKVTLLREGKEISIDVTLEARGGAR
ncbi:MAG: M28 family peptidase [Phycisphaerales bacterium]|nr:M28 family peptidase [Phycisphaerales bacterium]